MFCVRRKKTNSHDFVLFLRGTMQLIETLRDTKNNSREPTKQLWGNLWFQPQISFLLFSPGFYFCVFPQSCLVAFLHYSVKRFVDIWPSSTNISELFFFERDAFNQPEKQHHKAAGGNTTSNKTTPQKTEFVAEAIILHQRLLFLFLEFVEFSGFPRRCLLVYIEMIKFCINCTCMH